MILLEQTDESKSIDALTESYKAKTRPESSRSTETKGRPSQQSPQANLISSVS